MVERSGRRGIAGNFAPVVLDAAAAPGALVTVQVQGLAGEDLRGAISAAAAA